MLTDKQIRAIGKKILLYRALRAPGAFHKSRAKYRWIFGGNRSGKSESNIGFDLCSFALGVHPFRKTPKNAVIWAVAPTWDMVGTILWQEKMKDYLPSAAVASIAWHNKSKDVPAIIRLANGNRIELKAFEQGRVTFQGRSIDAIYNDEQCEHDYEPIFQEQQMRLADPYEDPADVGCERFLAWSMTPLIPQANIEARATNPGPRDNIFFADLNDNRISRGGYILDEEVDALIDDWPEEVQETRIKGHFAAFLGAVYKSFRRAVHVVPTAPVTGDVERYRAIDLGFNNPFCCLWLARDHDGCWTAYNEHYRARESLAYQAGRIKAISGAERYVATWADHDAQDVFELAVLGVETLPAKKEVRLGIELVQSLLKVRENGRPKLAIQEHCIHLISEMIGYRWREGTERSDPLDEPIKKDDHAVDPLRYAVYSVDGDSYFAR